MDLQRLSAGLLIAATVGVLLSSFVNAPRLYATQDVNERLQIIDAYRTRWLTSQAVGSVSAVMLALGFALLAWTLRKSEIPSVPILAGGAIIAGTLSALYFVYLQTIDPRGGYSGAYPTPENLAYWLWLAGQLLFGVAFLQAGLPAWLGYLTAGTALAYGVVFLLTGAGFMTPFLLALVALVMGVVMLRT